MLVGSTSASLYIGSNRVKAARQGASLRYFRPDSIPGLQAWWDASDTGSLTLNGANVSAVADKSGNGNTLSQASAAAQPEYTANLTNSLSGFTVTGGTDYMVGSVDGLRTFTGLTVFCVGESSRASEADQNTAVWWSWGHFGNASSPYPAFRGLSYGSGTGSLTGETQVTNVEYGSSGRIGSSVYSRSANSPTIESITFGSSGTQVYQYGSQVPQNLLSLATLSADYSPASIGYTLDDDVFLSALRIGGTPVLLPGAGDIGYGEVLIFDSQLSAADRQLVEGYLAWKWGLQSKLPYNHPYAPQAIGGGSQTVPTDSDAIAYLAAAAAADGSAVERSVAIAIDDFVKGLKADGLWSAIGSACVLAGARTVAGALVPLKGAAPTGYNWVASDYSRSLGLKGDGSTKYIDSNRANNADPQNDKHLAAYISDRSADGGAVRGVLYAGYNGLDGSSGIGYRASDGTTHFQVNNNAVFLTIQPTLSGLAGASRTSPGGFTALYNGTTSIVSSRASQVPTATTLKLFTQGSGTSSVRLGFYSIGASLDLALLDARVSALMSALGAAL